MADPYRTTETPADTRGPDIAFAGIDISSRHSRRALDYVFVGGRCHILLGSDSALLTILELAAGFTVPEGGSVSVGGKPASKALGSLYRPVWDSRRPFWERLIPLLKRSNIVRLERALSRGVVCAVDSPYFEVNRKPVANVSVSANASANDSDRVGIALRGAVARGATVLVRTREWAEAIGIGDIFHVLDEDQPIRHGDIETIFRPDHTQPAAPDAVVNKEESSSCVAFFSGVVVPLFPQRSDMSVSGIGADGHRMGFMTHRYHCTFHVPARHVVANPSFEHGAKSGSPPLPLYPALPPPGHSVGDPFVPPQDLDRTSRYVVLEGEVGARYPIGAYERVGLLAERNYRFQVDLPQSARAQAKGRLRFGFDTAHVVSTG